jgi:hypothetical protein
MPDSQTCHSFAHRASEHLLESLVIMAELGTRAETDTKTETVQVLCECEISEGGLIASEAGELLKCLAELAELLPELFWEERPGVVDLLKETGDVAQAEEFERNVKTPQLVIRQMSIYNPWQIVAILQYVNPEQILHYISAIAGITTILVNKDKMRELFRKSEVVPVTSGQLSRPAQLPKEVVAGIENVAETLVTGTPQSYPRPVERVTRIVLRLSALSLKITKIEKAS